MEQTAKEYPKWVQREPDIGAVLCKNKAEEDKLMGDWAAEQVAKAEKVTKAAEEVAAAAKAQAELTLKATEAQAELTLKATKK
jgi:hypothetical protein